MAVSCGKCPADSVETWAFASATTRNGRQEEREEEGGDGDGVVGGAGPSAAGRDDVSECTHACTRYTRQRAHNREEEELERSLWSSGDEGDGYYFEVIANAFFGMIINQFSIAQRGVTTVPYRTSFSISSIFSLIRCSPMIVMNMSTSESAPHRLPVRIVIEYVISAKRRTSSRNAILDYFGTIRKCRPVATHQEKLTA